MTDEQYQIGLSTLFIGYVLMQVPSNALLNYAGRPSIYIGFFVSACFYTINPSSRPNPRDCYTTHGVFKIIIRSSALYATVQEARWSSRFPAFNRCKFSLHRDRC